MLFTPTKNIQITRKNLSTTSKRSRLKIKIIWKYSFIFLFTPLSFTGSMLQAGDENPTFDLYIESKTVNSSANCVIQNADPENDKKRTEIGVGETVNLELKGKRLGEVTSATWKIVSDQSCASVEAKAGNFKKAVLEAKKNSTADGSATVEVTTNIDSNLNPSGSRQKTFQIRVPSSIKARHSGMRVQGYPEDGDKQIPGASSMLVLTLSPLTVSFQNIHIKEEAKKGDGHDTGTGSLNIDERNEAWCDQIGSKIPNGYTIESPDIQKHAIIGQDKSWSCGWYTYANEQLCCHISGNDFIQVKKMERDGIRKNQIYELKVTVSKFGASTSRSTTGEAKHQDINSPE